MRYAGDHSRPHSSHPSARTPVLPICAAFDEGNAGVICHVSLPISNTGLPSMQESFPTQNEFEDTWTTYADASTTSRDVDLDGMLAVSSSINVGMNNPTNVRLYNLLVKAIFAFRPSFMIEWTLDHADDSRRSEGLRHVSELCAALQQWLSFNTDAQFAPNLAMLVDISAELIKDIYRPLLGRCLAVLHQARQLSKHMLEHLSTLCATINSHAQQMSFILEHTRQLEGVQQAIGAPDYASMVALQCLQRDACHVLQLLSGYGV
jgi:hypothetical protein